ncbi:hypothetical protein ACFWNK_33825 [Streptomyces sp. NPDC058417]|uniref:hypothetical protein n=1 Tax=unclassified Streptomyces TaxID=2593676 RepID=UPI003660DE0D
MIVARAVDAGRVGRSILTVRKRRAADRGDARSHSSQEKSTSMNLLTDILAGLIHFVGWLV